MRERGTWQLGSPYENGNDSDYKKELRTLRLYTCTKEETNEITQWLQVLPMPAAGTICIHCTLCVLSFSLVFLFFPSLFVFSPANKALRDCSPRVSVHSCSLSSAVTVLTAKLSFSLTLSRSLCVSIARFFASFSGCYVTCFTLSSLLCVSFFLLLFFMLVFYLRYFLATFSSR